MNQLSSSFTLSAETRNAFLLLPFVVAFPLVLGACSSMPEETGAVADTDVGTSAITDAGAVSEVISSNDNLVVSEAASAIPGSEQDLEFNVGDRVFFATDSSELDAQSQATLQRQADWLQRYRDINVRIEGHADERGTREYNLGLSQRRANMVREYLISLGISAERLDTIPYGKERPVALCSNENCWKQNRRAVTTVIAPGSS